MTAQQRPGAGALVFQEIKNNQSQMSGENLPHSTAVTRPTTGSTNSDRNVGWSHRWHMIDANVTFYVFYLGAAAVGAMAVYQLFELFSA